MNLRTVLPPVLVAVLGLGALSGIQDTGFREQIEADLTERAQSALSAARLYGADVTVTGRDADVAAPTAVEAIEAAAVVREVEGIRVAEAYGPDGSLSAESGETTARLSQSTPAATASADPGESASAEVTPSPEPSDPSEPTEPASGGGSEEDAESEPPRNPTREERVDAQEDLVEIPNITFFTDSARLTKDGRRVVREAAEVLEEHPEVEVRIEGHTDSRGTEAHNLRLSERRADKVLDRLAKLGVDRDRLTAKGYGEEDPLVTPRTFADLEKNRRVEFTVRHQISRSVVESYCQRFRRVLRRAIATGPAVEVRSTCGPSRAVRAPASVSRATSASEIPPSGPTTTSSSPTSGSGSVVSPAVASSCSTATVPPAATTSRVRAASCLVVSGTSTSGIRERRACLVAARTVLAQRARDFAARSPRQTTTERSACHGMIASAPTSVAASMAISSRSPLARAWTSVTTTTGTSSTST